MEMLLPNDLGAEPELMLMTKVGCGGAGQSLAGKGSAGHDVSAAKQPLEAKPARDIAPHYAPANYCLRRPNFQVLPCL